MRGYGSLWVLVLLLVVLSVLIHLAAWKWAVMKRLKAQAKNRPAPPASPAPLPKDGTPPAPPAS